MKSESVDDARLAQLMSAQCAWAAECVCSIEDDCVTEDVPVKREAFDDICCGLGERVAGITFCDLKPDVPGRVDAEYKEIRLEAGQEITLKCSAELRICR